MCALRPDDDKEAMRAEMRARLRAMSPNLRAEASLVICQTAVNLPQFRQASCVAVFAPLPSEPNVHPLIEEAWAKGKRVVLPLMTKHATVPELDWHEIAGWDEVFVPGPFGLREPDPLRCRRVPPAELDCVFVPGLAFDAAGARLGRGGGFYDSFLAKAPKTLPCIGLFFNEQQVERVPSEAHDQMLLTLITEDGLWDCVGGQ